MAEEKEVFIRSIIYYIKNLASFMPLDFRHYLSHIFVGEGMEFFVGRAQK